MYFDAGERDYEQAAVERNRLQAVRALLERQRVANEARRLDGRGRGRGRRHGGQRPGLPGPRRRALATASPSTSTTRPATTSPAPPRSSCCSTTRARCRIPALIVVQAEVARGLGARRARGDPGRAPRRTGRDPRRRARRQAAHPRARRAQRAARARPGQAQGRAPPPAARRGARRAPAGARARRAAGAHRVLRHLQPGGTHTVASMVVFEGGAPKKSDYRRFTHPRPSTGVRRLRLDERGAARRRRRSSRPSASCRPTTRTATRASRRCRT